MFGPLKCSISVCLKWSRLYPIVSIEHKTTNPHSWYQQTAIVIGCKCVDNNSYSIVSFRVIGLHNKRKLACGKHRGSERGSTMCHPLFYIVFIKCVILHGVLISAVLEMLHKTPKVLSKLTSTICYCSWTIHACSIALTAIGPHCP